MFTNDVVEAKRQQIFLQSINARTLKSILDFVYSGEICINQVRKIQNLDVMSESNYNKF